MRAEIGDLRAEVNDWGRYGDWMVWGVGGLEILQSLELVVVGRTIESVRSRVENWVDYRKCCGDSKYFSERRFMK